MAADWKKMLQKVKRHSGMGVRELEDVAGHGADSGWPGFTYYTETNKFYDDNEELIWDCLEEDADSMGAKSIMEFIGGFGCAHTIQDLTTFKNALAWYALEGAARYLVDLKEEAKDRRRR